MITAVIQHKKDTLVVELPRANTDLQIKLLSIGVRILPQNIKLFGGEDAEIDVQLASSSRVGQHLCRLFNTENSLGDVNTTAYLVQTADEDIKTDLEHDIYYDQYGTAAELINDIKDRTLALGPVKMSLYFPLTGNIDEGDGNPFTVGDSFLYDYRYDINDLIEEYQDRDVEDILEYFDGDAGAKAKLVSAQWSTEIVDGTLYGKVDLRLREELTEDELTSVKDWITGQNSDGAFESLEDHPIDSEDGKLSISLWHGGNDYFVCREEGTHGRHHQEIPSRLDRQGQTCYGRRHRHQRSGSGTNREQRATADSAQEARRQERRRWYESRASESQNSTKACPGGEAE